MTSRPRRVVITGIGPIAAVGIGREDFIAGLAEGREGRRPPSRIEAPADRLPQLAECLDFFVEDYLESEKTYLDRCSALLLGACALAFEDAGLDWSALDHPRVALSVGTAYGCLDSMHNVTARVQAKGLRFASPMIFTHSFANSPASLAAIEFGIQGPAATFCTGDTSSGAALQYALDLVARGRVDVALAGGVDALSDALVAAFVADPPRGLVPGEGACIVALEGEQEARARGANILAELAGVALAGPAGDAQAAVSAARVEAGLGPDEAPALEPPGLWGHVFGAELALRVAAALAEVAGADAGRVAALTDPGGRSAAAVLRGCR